MRRIRISKPLYERLKEYSPTKGIFWELGSAVEYGNEVEFDVSEDVLKVLGDNPEQTIQDKLDELERRLQ